MSRPYSLQIDLGNPFPDLPNRLSRPAPPRLGQRGFSLIEIIVAMAICLLGLAAVLQMSNLSQAFARKAADAVELQILAQNRINEVLAGIAPLEAVSEGRCPENPEIGYSLSLEPDRQLPLVLLEVTVRAVALPTERAPAAKPQPQTPTPRRRDQRERELTLRRWLALSSQMRSTMPTEPEVRGPVFSPSSGMVPPSDNDEVGNQ